jgi:N-acetylmuramoyl-L-alanine amidase
LHNRGTGTYDPGATYLGHAEHTIVSQIAGMTRFAFQNEIEVLVVEEDTLPNIVKAVNDIAQPGDVLISLHMNAGGKKATGAEVVYAHNAPDLRRVQAKVLADTYAKYVGLPSRGALKDTDTPAGKPRILPDGTKIQGLPILRDTNIPAFLFELGFITNTKDRDRVQSQGGSSLGMAIRKLRDTNWEEVLVK